MTASQHDSIVPADPGIENRPSVPEWRREVTQKVKAYGERKKILITPPGPLKQTAVESEPGRLPAEPPAVRPAPTRPPAIEQPPVLPRPHTQAAPPSPAPASVSPRPASAPPIHPPPNPILQMEVQADDFDEAILNGEKQQVTTVPLLLARRTFALLIDTVILVGLNFFLLYVCAEIIGYGYGQLLQQAWLPFICVFLLFHCVYYVYFYRTSRQTPGQVFLGIEIKNPSSGTLSASRILVRWTAMVFLNVLNLLTLLNDNKYLLHDRLSSTEIRRIR